MLVHMSFWHRYTISLCLYIVSSISWGYGRKNMDKKRVTTFGSRFEATRLKLWEAITIRQQTLNEVLHCWQKPGSRETKGWRMIKKKRSQKQPETLWESSPHTQSWLTVLTVWSSKLCISTPKCRVLCDWCLFSRKWNLLWQFRKIPWNAAMFSPIPCHR